MSKAVLIFRYKLRLDGGSIVELKIWQLAKPVRGSKHVYKYSLFYGCDGKRFVGYDNEAGKGDHRHYGDKEEIYYFTTLERLIKDFQADVEKWQRRNYLLH